MELSKLKYTPKRLEILKRLGINDSEEVLRYYPFRYEKYEIMPFKSFKEGERVVFEGEIISSPSSYRYKRNLSIVRFKVLVEDEYELTLTIFNRIWAKMLKINDRLIIIGKYEGERKVTVMNYYSAAKKDMLGIIPVYPLKEGMSQNDIKKIIDFTIKKTDFSELEMIPSKYVKAHGLCSFNEAINNIHHPQDELGLKKALARLKYEEFLNFYLALELLRGEKSLKMPKVFDIKKIDELISSLEFDLTKDQAKAIKEILDDMQSDKIMYRLLEGDVGSGKTIVAIIALYANYLSGHKGVMMAPTEILAYQHFESLVIALEALGVRIELLTGSSKDKEGVKKRLKEGDFDIVIGTHALFYEDVKIADVSLIITDEQQRFGVMQRRKLKNKGENSDFLMMSATPIPRTLANTIYGDMDVSIIETMPKERKGCDTFLLSKNDIKPIVSELRAILDKGEQIYVIAAAISKSEMIKAKDVYELEAELKKIFPEVNIGTLHGKMSAGEKEVIMKAFYDRKIAILISTTVVEVGVSVKNATAMVVYDADRFGLSQLHQLRGRIQRGNRRGTFYLLSDSKDENTLKRLKTLTMTNDGFKIALEDLKIRGMGDILGTRQSGLPDFILGNIFSDTKIIVAAKEDAKKIAQSTDEKALELKAKILKKASQSYID